MQKDKIGPIIKDDEIDLVALVKTIWAGRKTIYYSMGIALLIGIVIAFTSPAKYSASTTLLPSAEKKSSNLGGLGALAGMAGINLGAMMGDASGIPAEIYPQVMESYPFLNELVHQKFNFEKYEAPISYYDYQMADTIPTVGGNIMKYTLGLPWTIKNAIFGEKNKDEALLKKEYGVLELTEDEEDIFKSLQDKLSVEVDKKSGLISVKATTEEPVFAAQLVQKAIELLQQYVIDYKTQQTRQNLLFVEESYNEKKAEYENAQRAFFTYKDRHRNIVSERVDVEYQQLSDTYDMASTVFKGLAQQLEQAKIAVKEETPAFTVLEPAKVPLEKSSPKKKLIAIVSVFLGGFIGLGVIFGRLVWEGFSKREEEE